MERLDNINQRRDEHDRLLSPFGSNVELGNLIFLDQLETERRPGLIKFGNSDVVYILCANDNHWIVKSNIDFTKEPNNDFDNYNLESDRMNWFMYDTLNSKEHATSCQNFYLKHFLMMTIV